MQFYCINALDKLQKSIINQCNFVGPILQANKARNKMGICIAFSLLLISWSPAYWIVTDLLAKGASQSKILSLHTIF